MDTEPTLDYALGCQWQSQLESMGFRPTGREIVLLGMDESRMPLYRFRWRDWSIQAHWAHHMTVGFELYLKESARAAVYAQPRLAYRSALELIEFVLYQSPEVETQRRLDLLVARIEERYGGYVHGH